MHTQAGIWLKTRTMGKTHDVLPIGAKVGIALPCHRGTGHMRASVAPRMQCALVADDEQPVVAINVRQKTLRPPLDQLLRLAQSLGMLQKHSGHGSRGPA
jgi:hypothetical protein